VPSAKISFNHRSKGSALAFGMQGVKKKKFAVGAILKQKA
jgi:hypothetical protein